MLLVRDYKNNEICILKKTTINLCPIENARRVDMYISRRVCPYLYIYKEKKLIKRSLVKVLNEFSCLMGGERFDVSNKYKLVFGEKMNKNNKLNETFEYRIYENSNKKKSVVITEINKVSLIDFFMIDKRQKFIIQTKMRMNEDEIKTLGICAIDSSKYVYEFIYKKEILNLKKIDDTKFSFETTIPQYSDAKYAFFIINSVGNGIRVFHSSQIRNDNIEKSEYNEAIYRSDKAKSENHARINFGIWGSCYSRNAFTSTEYFNPNYKNKYKVSYTQFHSSICSVDCTSDFKYEEKYFEDLNPHFKLYIKNDLQKSFFQKEQMKNLDFFIIDLWQDVHRGYVEFEERGIISNALFFSYHTNYLDDSGGKYKIIKPTANFEEYIKTFNLKLDVYVREILKYLPQERIIVNRIKYSKEYYDENGDKKIFKEQLLYADKINAISCYLEELLISKIPKCKIINARWYNYIASQDFPGKLSGNHYESAYYKKFMEDIDTIVINSIKEE